MASIFDKLKKKPDNQPTKTAEGVDVKPVKQDVEKPAEGAKKEEKVTKSASTPAASTTKKSDLKGKTTLSDRILIKPLVTEKAAHIGAEGKYAFMVDPEMNKIEIKKAIRTVYGVEPVSVNIINMLGKNVRYGRKFGCRQDWKKAIITLKPGDKIEIYEGV